MSVISTTVAADFARLTSQRVSDLDNRNGNPSYNAKLGTVVKDLADVVTALDGVAVAATTTTAGLQSAADKSKQDSTKIPYLASLEGDATALAGTVKQRALGFAVAPGTVTSVKWMSEGTATSAPAAAPNNMLVEVLKGATVVASKTYTAPVTPYTWDALTLSAVAGATTVAANDALLFRITQNGTCLQVNVGSVFQAVVTPV